MRGCRRLGWGWWVLFLAGCGEMLPPPMPPKFRTAEPQAPAPVPTDLKPTAAKARALRGLDSAPDHFRVNFATSKGEFVVDVHRHWAPLAADRFHQLVKEGYYDGNKFFRVAAQPKIVQFGLNGDPKVTAKYLEKGIEDEPRTQSNTRGTLAFAKSGAPNSRSMQLFINRGDNSGGLDPQGFAPFGKIVKGLEEAVDQITSEYSDESGQGPDQGTIIQSGNVYLDERFPNLDYIIKATIVGDEGEKAEGAKTEDAGAVKEEPKEVPAEGKAEAKDEPAKEEAK